MDKTAAAVVCCIFVCASVIVIFALLCGGSMPEAQEISKGISLTDTALFQEHSYLKLDNNWIHDPDCKKCLDRFPVIVTPPENKNLFNIPTNFYHDPGIYMMPVINSNNYKYYDFNNGISIGVAQPVSKVLTNEPKEENKQ